MSVVIKSIFRNKGSSLSSDPSYSLLYKINAPIDDTPNFMVFLAIAFFLPFYAVPIFMLVTALTFLISESFVFGLIFILFCSIFISGVSFVVWNLLKGSLSEQYIYVSDQVFLVEKIVFKKHEIEKWDRSTIEGIYISNTYRASSRASSNQFMMYELLVQIHDEINTYQIKKTELIATFKDDKRYQVMEIGQILEKNGFNVVTGSPEGYYQADKHDTFSKIRECPICNHNLQDSDRFCMNCGNPIE